MRHRGHGLFHALLALAIGAGVAWFALDAHQAATTPRNFGTVVDGTLYRSGQIEKKLIRDVLVEHDIQRIVNMQTVVDRNDPHFEAQHAEERLAKAMGIDYVRISMSGDGLGTVEQYADVIALMHQAVRDGEPTLVHCSAGAQRTGGTVAAYRLLVQGVDPAAVEAEARRYGWEPSPTSVWPDFINAHMQALAEALVARGVIDMMPDPLPVFP